MAIPFNLPSDEETEENYRRLDQLLLDLYDVLRQILLRRRIQRGVIRPEGSHHQHLHNHHQHHHNHQDGSGSPGQQPSSHQSRGQAHQLPDLVPGSHGPAAPLVRKPPVPPPRRRRRRAASDGKQQQQVQQQQGPPELLQQGPSWLNVGIELRQIAEEFRSSQPYGEEEKTRKEIKASSLFSLLVPAPLAGSIWTTVIILVGWRILAARHR